MAASYPVTVKSFATISNGDIVDASDPNDIQNEVTAVEGGLLNGFAHNLLPDANNTRDIGSDALRWANGHFQSLKVAGVSVGAGDSDQTVLAVEVFT